jgi:hypothetical protein
MRFNRTVTPPLLCSSERQELHAGSRPADIAGKTSLARHRWQDFAAKTPHDQPARSPAAVEVRTLAVA